MSRLRQDPSAGVFVQPFPATGERYHVRGSTAGRRGFDVLPDRRLVSVVSADDAAAGNVIVNEVKLIVNWFEELRPTFRF